MARKREPLFVPGDPIVELHPDMASHIENHRRSIRLFRERILRRMAEQEVWLRHQEGLQGEGPWQAWLRAETDVPRWRRVLRWFSEMIY